LFVFTGAFRTTLGIRFHRGNRHYTLGCDFLEGEFYIVVNLTLKKLISVVVDADNHIE
jgi:hypothetical protein